MTYHRVVTRVTRGAPLEEQELPTIPEHLSYPPVFIFYFFFITYIAKSVLFMLSSYMSSHFQIHVVMSAVICRYQRCSPCLYSDLCCKGFVFYTCYLYLFTYSDAPRYFHFIWCSCHLAVTRRVSLAELELLTLPEHMVTPGF